MLDQTADRDRSNVTGWRRGLREGEPDVYQRRAPEERYARDRCPVRLGDVAVRLRPKFAPRDPDAVEDPDVLVVGKAGQPVGRGDES